MRKSGEQCLFWLPAFLLTSIGFILSFFALNPGLMSYDTFYMYDQGVTLDFTDWHHPFLPVLMLVSRIISGDTALLLFLQLACSWAGIYLFAVSLKNQIGNWAILSILIGYTPIVLNQLGFMGKTSLQTSMFLLVFGACYYYYSSQNRPSLQNQILLLFPLFLGTTIRSYSYISAIPLTLFFVYVVIKNDSYKYTVTKCILTTVALLSLFVVVEKTIIYKIINVERTYKSQSFFEYDLAGIMAQSGTLYATKLLLPEFRNENAISEYYKQRNGSWQIIKIFGEDKKKKGRVNQNITNKEDVEFLFKEWVNAIIDHPLIYLKHRYQAISLALGFHHKVKGLRTEKIFNTKTNKHQLHKAENLTWNIYKKYNKNFQKTILFKPWFWFLLNSTVFLLSIYLLSLKKFSRRILPHVVLNTSGTLFYILYLIIGLSADARYVYWGMVSTAFSTLGIAAIIIKSRIKPEPISA